MAANDPYGSTDSAGASAREALNVPAIAMMIMASLGVMMSLPGLFGGGSQDMVNQILAKSGNMNREQAEMIAKVAEASAGVVGKLFTLLSIGLNSLIVFGAFKMRQLQSFPMAMTASILMIVPCGGGCCWCLGIPLGIWAITILNRPEVKAQFTSDQ